MDCLFVNFTSVVLILFLANFGRADTGGCALEASDKNQPAYLQWPVTLDCNDVYSTIRKHFRRTGFEKKVLNFTCTMRYKERNGTFYRSTFHTKIPQIRQFLEYEHNDVTAETPREVEIKIQSLDNGTCATQKLFLQIEQLPDIQCSDLEISSEREFRQGSTGSLVCRVKEGPALNVSDYNVKWFYNCAPTLPNGTVVSNEKLIIQNADYSLHPGGYSCVIEHNGETRYLLRYDVCLKQDRGSPSVTVKCRQPELYVNKGDDVTVTCDITDDDDNGIEDDYTAIFKRNRLLPNGTIDRSKGDISCAVDVGQNRTTSPYDDRVSCVLLYMKQGHIPDGKCFGDVPSKEEWETEKNNRTKTRLIMSYEILNIKEDDFGTFEAFAENEYSGSTSNYTFLIVEDRGHPEHTASIIGICIGSVLAFILVGTLCAVFSVEIRWTWKHYFAKQELKMKEYGAFITYYWSNVEDEKVKTANYERLVEKIKETLEKVYCTTYDTQQKLALNKYENIHEVQQKCDRIIIILTPEYLLSEDSVFDLYANFLESSFIFIKTPGVNKAINDLEERRRNAVKVAMRRNYVIGWSGRCSELSGRFKRRLELAVPKRKIEKAGLVYENKQQCV